MKKKLLKYYKQVKKNLKEGGVKVTAKKAVKYIRIRLTRKITLNQRSLQNWKTLKGQYAGKRAFLLGNGPSLNKTQLYLLENEHTMCFNRFNIMFERLSWKPTFYMNIDPLVAQDMAAEVNEITPQVKLAFFPDIHTNGLDFRTFIDDRENVQWMFPQYKDFYFDLPNVALGGSVAYPALQVLTYLGFSEIYLIGVDMNYQIHKTVTDIKDTDVASTQDDDPNHFDPRYFGTGRKYHQPVKKIVDNIMGSFEFAADKIKANTTTRVLNAGIGSKVECFEKVNFADLFSYTDEEEFALFSKAFADQVPFKTYKEMQAQVPVIAGKGDIKDTMPYFLVDFELGHSIIKELVFTHIVYGPYKNNYLFIKRKINL